MYRGMNRGLLDMTLVDCFIIIVWWSIVLLSIFAVFSLINFSWRCMNNISSCGCSFLIFLNDLKYLCMYVCMWWNKRFIIIIIICMIPKDEFTPWIFSLVSCVVFFFYYHKNSFVYNGIECVSTLGKWIKSWTHFYLDNTSQIIALWC